MRELLHALAIVLLSVVAAVVYGTAHDLVTAHVCIEYFTIGHPPVFHTERAVLLALGWGVIATWWMGLAIGVPLALAARAGSRPRRSARSLVRSIAVLLAVMAACALAAGLFGWRLAASGAVHLVGSIARRVPPDRHVPYLADLWAHSTSYLVGLVGGLVLVAAVWRGRRRAASGGPSRHERRAS